MKLFEYADAFAQLFDSYDAICEYEPDKNQEGQYIDDDGNIIPDIEAYKADMETAWFDTLEGIELNLNAKAENIAGFIKQLDGELEMLKKQKAKRTAIDTPSARISIRNNAQSADILDEKSFVAMCIKRNLKEYLRFKEPEINKTAVKNALKAGEAIPGAELKRTQSLVIR